MFLSADRPQVIAAQHPHRAVAAIRYIDAVGRSDVGDALRLAKARHRTQHLTGRQIDDAQALPRSGLIYIWWLRDRPWLTATGLA